ncbi:MAG: YncE family protein [Bacteroidota bacterium]|nr:YncE family protein [Bacteroidota bacterium]
MKKLKLSIAVLLGSAALFLACSKDETSTNKALVNFDAAYVVNGESNTISIINITTNKVAETIDLTQLQSSLGTGQMEMGMTNMWPHHIYISPDKSKLVIAAAGMDLSEGHNMSSTGGTTDAHSQHHGGSAAGSSASEPVMPGRILILDAVTGELLKELSLEGMTHNAVFSPDSKELWTSLMMPEGLVKVFDTVTYSLITSIPVGQMPAEVTFSDDGKKVFVANGMSNTVTVIDAATKKVIETITVGNNPVGAWPGMNGMMYVDNEDGQSISMVNSMTNMMTDTVNLGFTPGMAVRNSQMNQMWVSDPYGSKIHMWATNNDEIHMLEKGYDEYIHGGVVAVGKGAHAIAFNKEGNVGYVTNQTEGTVSVVDVPNLKEMMKIDVGKKPNGIVIRNK